VVAFGAMARCYVTLAEHPSDMVRLACTKCERRGGDSGRIRFWEIGHRSRP